MKNRQIVNCLFILVKRYCYEYVYENKKLNIQMYFLKLKNLYL